uniref:SET domain-containing protein n=1 Tax=Moniliophthora roreri TaxID=221103 RepID=A0A0W0FZY7_MONRR
MRLNASKRRIQSSDSEQEEEVDSKKDTQLVGSVFRDVWFAFYRWQETYQKSSIESLRAPNPSKPQQNSMTSLFKDTADAENEYLYITNFDSPSGTIRIPFMPPIEIKHTILSQPSLSYDSCTPISRNLMVGDDPSDMPFIPLADDPIFPIQANMSFYKAFAWQNMQLNDPDMKVISIQTAQKLVEIHGMTLEAIDATEVLPFTLLGQRGLLYMGGLSDLLAASTSLVNKGDTLPRSLIPPNNTYPSLDTGMILGADIFLSGTPPTQISIAKRLVAADRPAQPRGILATLTSTKLLDGIVDPCGKRCFVYGGSLTRIHEVVDWTPEDTKTLKTVLKFSPDISPCDLAVICRKPCIETQEENDQGRYRKKIKMLKINTNTIIQRSIWISDTLHRIPLALTRELVLPIQNVCASATAPAVSTVANVIVLVNDAEAVHVQKAASKIPVGLCGVRASERGGSDGYMLTCSARVADSSLCRNVCIQRGVKKNMQVKDSQYGFGCFLLEPASLAELVVEYVGELIYETTIDSRDDISVHRSRNYVFELNNCGPGSSDGISIDSFYAGNESRYINHSEENANCTAVVKLVNGEHRIGIYAAKNIPAAEELFLNYGPMFFKDHGNTEPSVARSHMRENFWSPPRPRLRPSMSLLRAPGILFLFKLLVLLSIPPIATILFKKLLDFIDIHIPTWLYILAAALCLPAYAMTASVLKEDRQRREANTMGARLAPKVKGKWPGNVDIIVEALQKFRFGYPGERHQAMMNKLGSPCFNLALLGGDILFTCEPEHIQQILATNFNSYEKGETFRKELATVLGVGVFNANGDMWKFHRQMTRPFFTRDRIVHFDIFDRHADAVLTQMKQRLRSGYPVDFQDLMGRFALDAATEFLFGSCVNSLSASPPYPYNAPPELSAVPETDETRRAQAFATAFLEAQEVVGIRLWVDALWPLVEFWEDKTEKPMKIVNSFIEPIIAEALAKKKATGRPSKEVKEEIGDDETLLDHLVDLTDGRDAIVNIMIAGRDTTTGTLTFIVYFLAKYPHVTARLREEVLSKVGPSRRPTYDDVREMKYLRAVINETLRLYPVVPFNTRTCVQSTTWISPDPSQKPIYVPAGSLVPYSVLLMHRRKDLWGPDAEEFDPNRFLDERLKKYLTPRPFIFLPFNAGPRICLGQQFAYNEMSFMLIRLMQNFESFTFEPTAVPPEFHTPPEWEQNFGRQAMDKFFPKLALTMYSGGGLWIRAKEAEEGGS